MKKLILSVTAMAACSVGAYAQGTITFDGSNNSNTSSTATTGGEVFISNTLDTSIDINAELLYSSTGTAGTFSPVVTLLLSSQNTITTPTLGQIGTASGDVSGEGNGTLLDLSGQTYVIPTIASSATAYFEVQGWLGNYGSLTAAAAAGQKSATTAVFSEVLSGSNPPYADVNNMPALNLTSVPEPSTFAMAGVGLASMLIFRRRNK
jgi:hypothetical protein